MPLRYLVGALAVFLAIAGVSITVYRDSQELYLTVDELVAQSDIYPLLADGTPREPRGADETSPGRVVRVRGDVDYDSLERPQVGLEVRFTLVGDAARVPVVYQGIVPDTFEQAEAITVVGTVAEDGTFIADDLMVQCPSKYEAAPPTAQAGVEAES